MPEPAGLGPETAQRAITAIKAAYADGGGAAISRAEAAGLRIIIGGAADELAAGEGAAALAGAEELGAALGEFGGFVVILVLVAAIGILDITLDAFRVIADIKVPLIGRPFYPIVDWMYRQVDRLYTPIYGYIRDEAGKLLPAIASIVGISIDTQAGKEQSPTTRAIQAQIAPVHREVDHLWAWVQTLSEQAQGVTHGHTVTVTGKPATVPQLSSDVDVLAEDLRILSGQVHRLESEYGHVSEQLTALTGEIQQLSHHLYGARALNFGVQDIASQLTDIRDRLNLELGAVDARVDAQGNTLQTLLPLTALTRYGARGVENLQRLSDEPCQCLPNPLPELIPALLAMDMVAKDGF